MPCQKRLISHPCDMIILTIRYVIEYFHTDFKRETNVRYPMSPSSEHCQTGLCMLRPTNKRPRQDQVYSTDVQNRLYYGNKSVKTLYKTITTHCVTPGRGYLKSQVLVNIHLIEGTITKPQQKESEGGVVTLAFPSFPIVRHDSTHRRKPAPRVMASGRWDTQGHNRQLLLKVHYFSALLEN